MLYLQNSIDSVSSLSNELKCSFNASIFNIPWAVLFLNLKLTWQAMSENGQVNISYWFTWISLLTEASAPSQYPKRRLSVRFCKVSKPRDLYLELSDRFAIWQAIRQQCCRCACQMSKRYDNLKYQYRGFETLRDLKKRRLFGYGDGALIPDAGFVGSISKSGPWKIWSSVR